MLKQQIVNRIIPHLELPQQGLGQGFAPSNIALCKYWGKRCETLNLPVTSSLSISMGHLGAHTSIQMNRKLKQDAVTLNRESLAPDSEFAKRLSDYLDLFRPDPQIGFEVTISMNIPAAAGLASSACGFAAVIKALDELYDWKLSDKYLSILARLGSGSAARSLWWGFVEWQAGIQPDGMDCFAYPMTHHWPELRVGLLVFDGKKKSISSRQAMRACISSSPFYEAWPRTVAHALSQVKEALANKDFWQLGVAVENNAMAMHALMMSTQPPVIYSNPETMQAMQKIWQARANGVCVFFTQDAGPNLKLLFLEQDQELIRQLFSQVQIVSPFEEDCIYA